MPVSLPEMSGEKLEAAFRVAVSCKVCPDEIARLASELHSVGFGIHGRDGRRIGVAVAALSRLRSGVPFNATGLSLESGVPYLVCMRVVRAVLDAFASDPVESSGSFRVMKSAFGKKLGDRLRLIFGHLRRCSCLVGVELTPGFVRSFVEYFLRKPAYARRVDSLKASVYDVFVETASSASVAFDPSPLFDDLGDDAGGLMWRAAECGLIPECPFLICAGAFFGKSRPPPSELRYFKYIVEVFVKAAARSGVPADGPALLKFASLVDDVSSPGKYLGTSESVAYHALRRFGIVPVLDDFGGRLSADRISKLENGYRPAVPVPTNKYGPYYTAVRAIEDVLSRVFGRAFSDRFIEAFRSEREASDWKTALLSALRRVSEGAPF